MKYRVLIRLLQDDGWWHERTAMKSYAYVIERAADGSYWAYLPDLPGCTTTADSPDLIEERLREAVELYLSYYRDRGQPTPEPQARVGMLSAA